MRLYNKSVIYWRSEPGSDLPASVPWHMIPVRPRLLMQPQPRKPSKTHPDFKRSETVDAEVVTEAIAFCAIFDYPSALTGLHVSLPTTKLPIGASLSLASPGIFMPFPPSKRSFFYSTSFTSNTAETLGSLK